MCDDIRIGRVLSVDKRDDGTVGVPLSIDDGFADKLREKTVFWVVAAKDGEAAQLLASVPDSGAPVLAEGANVRGADSPLAARLTVLQESIGSSLWAIVVIGAGILIVLLVLRIFLRLIALLFGLAVGVGVGMLVGPKLTPLAVRIVPADYPAELVAQCAVGFVAFVISSIIAARFVRGTTRSKP